MLEGTPNFSNPIFLEQFAKVQQGFGPAASPRAGKLQPGMVTEWSGIFLGDTFVADSIAEATTVDRGCASGHRHGSRLATDLRWTHDHNGWDVIGCKDQPLRFHYER